MIQPPLSEAICNGMVATTQPARRPSAVAVPGRWGACLAERTPPAAFSSGSIVVQDRADAAALGEQRVTAIAKQVQVKRLVGLLLAVALDFDGDRLGRL